jgi:hypothetical protein
LQNDRDQGQTQNSNRCWPCRELSRQRTPNRRSRPIGGVAAQAPVNADRGYTRVSDSAVISPWRCSVLLPVVKKCVQAFTFIGSER